MLELVPVSVQAATLETYEENGQIMLVIKDAYGPLLSVVVPAATLAYWRGLTDHLDMSPRRLPEEE